MAADLLNGNTYSPRLDPRRSPPVTRTASILFAFSRRGGGSSSLPASDRGLCGRVHAGRLRSSTTSGTSCGGQSNGGLIVKYTASSNSRHPVPHPGFSSTALALPFPTSPASFYDGNGNLFVSGTDSTPAGRVSKVNCTTGGCTTFGTSGFGAVGAVGNLQLPPAPSASTCRANLWMMLTNSPSTSGSGVVQISGNRGPNPPIFPPASQCQGFFNLGTSARPLGISGSWACRFRCGQVRAPLHAHPDGHGHLLSPTPPPGCDMVGQPGGREPD